MFHRLFIAGIALTLLLGAASTLYWPMGRDQGTFAWAADVILRGGIPYKDAWELKGPACHYTVAAAFQLLGRNDSAIRILDLAFVVVGMAALGGICRRIEGGFAAAIAITFYLFWYWGAGYWHTAQPDAWIAVIELVALRIVVGAKTPVHPARLAVAGFLIGVAALYKPPYGVCFIALLPAALDRGQPIRRRIISLLSAIVGCEIPLVATAAWFANRDALDDLIQIQFFFNLFGYKSAHRDSPLAVFEGIHGFWRSIEPVFTTSAAFVGARHLWHVRRIGAKTVVILLFTNVALVVVQNRYFAYHWVPVLGPLALLVGVGVSRVKWIIDNADPAISGRPSPHLLRLAASAVLVVTLLMAALHVGKKLPLWLACVMDRRPWSAYENSFPSTEDQQKVANHVNHHSRSSDGLLVWGFDPVINYLADRAAPTRFAFNYGLTREPPHALQAKWRAEFLADLQRQPPLYIVVADHDTEPLMPRTSTQYMADFPEFLNFAKDNYRVETKIGNYTLWRKRDAETIHRRVRPATRQSPIHPASTREISGPGT